MELNLRIDEDGRTTYDPANININIDSNKNKNKNKNKNNNDGTTTNPNQDLDFTSKAVLTNLASPSLTDSNNTKYDDLLFDCEVRYDVRHYIHSFVPFLGKYNFQRQFILYISFLRFATFFFSTLNEDYGLWTFTQNILGTM